jgi:hypothetical protein
MEMNRQRTQQASISKPPQKGKNKWT